MLSDEEIAAFVLQQKPENTKIKTKCDVNIFTSWMNEFAAEETRDLEDIPPVELNNYLRSFFLTVKKKSGDDYEPDSLKSIKYSLDRFLTERNYPKSIVRSEEFRTSREVLKAKGRQLKKCGKGQKENRATNR